MSRRCEVAVLRLFDDAVLGTKSLTVGSNDLSTEVSGVISGSGGSLTKTGSGTLDPFRRERLHGRDHGG